MSKYLRFIKEVVRWVLRGCPIRDEKKMSEIFQVCEQCPEFDRYAPGVDYGICKVCKCNLHRTDKKLNKIAWATTKCPLGRW